MEVLKCLPFSSVIGALEYQAQMKPEKVAVLYPDSNKNSTEYASLTYRQYNNVVNSLAHKIAKYLPNSSIEDESVTCSLLATGGIEYLLSQYAILKLSNAVMFPISARNSQAAVEHLLRETKTIVLITTTQYLPMVKLIHEKEEFQSLKVIVWEQDEFKIDELLNNKDIEFPMNLNGTKLEKSREEIFNKIVTILHSSGTTAYPKPIRLTNRYLLLGFSLYSSVNETFFSEDDVILAWAALFHLLAFNITVRAIVGGCTYALPLCVTFPPKPDELLRNIQVKNNISVLVAIPSLLENLVHELLSEKNNYIGLKPLAKLKFVTYAGAVCPDALCRTLVDNGISLISVYGATETSALLIKNYKPYDKRWKCMEIPSIRKPYLRIETPPNSQNPNEKIIVHLPNDPFLAENISNCSNGCYTVGDLLLEDPPNSGQYVILGRQDDTLVHVNGEKTNPIPMEDTIRQSSLVKQVAIVGHNQFCTAALIQLNIDESSKYSFQDIEDKIWDAVERANIEAPSHSRLVRQLVHILSMNETLPITEKGNLKRTKINQEYETLINTIYDKFINQQYQEQQNTLVNDPKEQLKWTEEKLKNYLKEKLQSIDEKIDDYSRSIFDFGINSLQIIELRNFICQDICEIPKNFLYENTSIEQISSKLFEYLQTTNIANQQNDTYHYELTEQIIDKYIDLMKLNKISFLNEKLDEKSQRIFLVTGSNGSLGSFIIRDLLQQSESTVKHIYCLLRGINTCERLFQSFEQRQLDTSILIKSLESKRLIILLSSMNLSEEHLGQTDSIYQELQYKVTDIIHAAWKMNFNQTIKDFEYDSILGVYHLLKLAASNHMQFHFISSISSAASGQLSHIKEEPLPRHTDIALPQGYGQSKYASEHLCWAAMNLWNVPVNIYRIGQVSGDTENGIWNTTEMAAMMIYAGAGQLKRMPNIGQDINWIPVNVCSAALVDLALKSSFEWTISTDQRVYHLLNPYVISYEDYLNFLRIAGLDFQTVSPKEFIDTILTTKDLTNPLIKLSSFFEEVFSKKDASKSSKFETIKTVERCKILKNCPSIDATLIKLYLNHWKKCQVLKE